MNDGVQRRAVNVTASMQDKAEAWLRDGDDTEMAVARMNEWTMNINEAFELQIEMRYALVPRAATRGVSVFPVPRCCVLA